MDEGFLIVGMEIIDKWEEIQRIMRIDVLEMMIM